MSKPRTRTERYWWIAIIVIFHFSLAIGGDPKQFLGMACLIMMFVYRRWILLAWWAGVAFLLAPVAVVEAQNPARAEPLWLGFGALVLLGSVWLVYWLARDRYHPVGPIPRRRAGDAQEDAAPQDAAREAARALEEPHEKTL